MPTTTSDHGPAPLLSVLEATSSWQMTLGERAAFTGLLDTLRPSLAIEIGTATGGSLRAMAPRCGHVHAFDLVPPPADVRELTNVTVHTGDSHALLARTLVEIAEQGRTVDFALVDGDHSAEGVARDIRDLLASPAVMRCAIVVHDTLNDEVRAGLESVDYDAHPTVVHVDLDWVPGRTHGPPIDGETWGGLGLILVDEASPRPAGLPARTPQFRSSLAELIAARDARALTETIVASRSWRLLAPLRRVRRRLPGRR